MEKRFKGCDLMSVLQMVYLGEEEASNQLVQTILRQRFRPPLLTTCAGPNLAITRQSLEAYLQALDQTGDS